MHEDLRRVLSGLGLIGIVGAACMAGAPDADAVSISPRRLDAVRGTPREAEVRAGFAAFVASWHQRVGDSFKQFALTPEKFSPEGRAYRNVLVVLVDFPADSYGPQLRHSSQSMPSYYNRLFFSDDPTDNITSMREFYRNNSHGRLVISGRVVPTWLTMPNSAAYYVAGNAGTEGAYPRNAQRLAEDALAAAYRELGDLSYFDNDGPDGIPASGDDDGYIDAVCVIHPGPGGEQMCDIPAGCPYLWSHQFGLAKYSDCPLGVSNPACLPGLPYGNVRGYLYVLLAEYTEFPGDLSNGTYCHEFGHSLGLPDLYDYTGYGLGFFSLMAYGNYLPYEPNCNPLSDPNCPAMGTRPANLDAWCRQYLGFETPAEPTQPGTQTLSPVSRGGGSIKLWTDGQPGSEYFLVEDRLQEGSDQWLPGGGLLLYHVDEARIDNTTGPANYRVRLLCADGRTDLESRTGNRGDAGDPFPGTRGTTSVTESTTPSTRSYAGQDTGLRLTNIAVTTTGASPAATFDLALSLGPKLQIAGWRTDDGGGNGYPDPGETIALTVTVRNAGAASGPIQYSLSTADPAISVTQELASGGALALGASETLTDAFTFTVGAVSPLPHDVPFVVSWNDGARSGSIAFTLAVGMGSGLAETFDAGLGNWTGTAIAPSVANEWHATDVRTHAGARSAKCGSTQPLGSGSNESQTYAYDMDAALTSPLFDLPPNMQLSFWSFIDAETNGGIGAYDGGRVEIAGADGEWEPLAVDGGYPYDIENQPANALRGSSAFSGSPNAWRRVVADLSGHSGPARIRFRFATDDNNAPVDRFNALARYYEGWYVDDVTIEPRVDPGPPVRRMSLRAGPSPFALGSPSAGLVHIRFSAKDGLPHAGAVGTVRVFDVNGRHLRTLQAMPDGIEPSHFETTWDARDDNGVKIASGIYFIQSELLGQTETFRLVVLK